MEEAKTLSVDIEVLDPLVKQQKEGVAKMRASLLASTDGTMTPAQAIQNVTVMRIYHQVARIIKYIELMDKLEDKLYEAIEWQIDNTQISNPIGFSRLLNIQERLQKTMIDSHKMLQPYLDVKEFSITELTPTEVLDSSQDLILTSESRDKIRSAAGIVMQAIKPTEVEYEEVEVQTDE